MESKTEHIPEIEQEWLALPPQLVDGKGSPTLSQRRAHLWALVLESRAVPSRAEPGEPGWQLKVPAERIEQALDELRLFEAKNRNWPPSAPAVHPLVENTLSTL